MEHFEFMEPFEPGNGSDGDAPDLLLGEGVSHLFVLADLLKEVAVVSKIHDDAQVLLIFKECFLVADNAGVLDRG
eukprot:CAMPEP_0170452252 /NCGR_PEP_ID=MMETSP0123-20130129/1210_1 /TAXON_ID=182087 /ORGANISM="Favella ehrenbergii, Strain Fehren 1" /LENGTH=74 /DNA_ID=CAMNT_0010714191 /DNA_START=2171 /DNA_END=2395 /DNA_ORIENTATION=+